MTLTQVLTNAAWFVLCAFVLCFSAAAGFGLIRYVVPRPLRRQVAIVLMLFLLVVLVTASKF